MREASRDAAQGEEDKAPRSLLERITTSNAANWLKRLWKNTVVEASDSDGVEPSPEKRKPKAKAKSKQKPTAAAQAKRSAERRKLRRAARASVVAELRLSGAPGELQLLDDDDVKNSADSLVERKAVSLLSLNGVSGSIV